MFHTKTDNGAVKTHGIGIILDDPDISTSVSLYKLATRDATDVRFGKHMRV